MVVRRGGAVFHERGNPVVRFREDLAVLPPPMPFQQACTERVWVEENVPLLQIEINMDPLPPNRSCRTTGVPHLQENAPPYDPTVRLCIGAYGDPWGVGASYERSEGVGVSYERGAPVGGASLISYERGTPTQP